MATQELQGLSMQDGDEHAAQYWADRLHRAHEISPQPVASPPSSGVGPSQTNLKQSKFVENAAEALIKLPLELAHQVLEDVPVYRILQMALSMKGSEHEAKFDQYLFGLRSQRSFFPTREYLESILVLYQIYFEIHILLQMPINPSNSPLAMNFNVARHYEGDRLERLHMENRRYLASEIYSMLHSLSPPEYRSLSKFIEDCDNVDWYCMPANISSFQGLWRFVKFQHKEYGLQRKEQMERFAQIAAKYPQLLLQASDPGVEPRKNTDHIVSTINGFTRKYGNALRDGRPVPKGRYLFKYDHFPMVPPDDLLRLFVDTLLRHPPPDATEGSTSRFLQLFRFTQDREPTRIYPPNVLKDVQIAIEGLAYIYTLPNESAHPYAKIHRTRYTPWSAPPYRKAFPSAPIPPKIEDEKPSLEYSITTPYSVRGLDDRIVETEARHLLRDVNLLAEQRAFTTSYTSTAKTIAEKQNSASVSGPWNKISAAKDIDSDKSLWTAARLPKQTLSIFVAPPWRHLKNHPDKVVTPPDYWGRDDAPSHMDSRLYHEKEFVWLEAFLRSVQWMKSAKL